MWKLAESIFRKDVKRPIQNMFTPGLGTDCSSPLQSQFLQVINDQRGIWTIPLVLVR